MSRAFWDPELVHCLQLEAAVMVTGADGGQYYSEEHIKSLLGTSLAQPTNFREEEFKFCSIFFVLI